MVFNATGRGAALPRPYLYSYSSNTEKDTRIIRNEKCSAISLLSFRHIFVILRGDPPAEPEERPIKPDMVCSCNMCISITRILPIVFSNRHQSLCTRGVRSKLDFAASDRTGNLIWTSFIRTGSGGQTVPFVYCLATQIPCL